MRRLLIFLVTCFALQAQAAPADDAALNEIAATLIQKGADGIPYGTLYYRSLPTAPDGKRVIRIYTRPYPRELALVNNHLWYALADPQPLNKTLQRWVIEEYSREIPELHFELTDNPDAATMFMLEARFVPNPRSGKSRDAGDYYKTAANSMNGMVGHRRAALIHFNTLGNPWLKDAIAKNEASTVRATILNELFNGFAVQDFQNLDRTRLSTPTQAWLDAHQAIIDDYTVTRSGGPRDDEYLKPLDHMLIRQLLRP